MSPIQYEKWTAQRILGVAFALGLVGYCSYQIIQSVLHDAAARYTYGGAFGLMGILIALISVRRSRDFIARHSKVFRFMGWGVVFLTLLASGWFFWSMDKRYPANLSMPWIICTAVAGIGGYVIAKLPMMVRDMLAAQKAAIARKNVSTGPIVPED